MVLKLRQLSHLSKGSQQRLGVSPARRRSGCSALLQKGGVIGHRGPGAAKRRLGMEQNSVIWDLQASRECFNICAATSRSHASGAHSGGSPPSASRLLRDCLLIFAEMFASACGHSYYKNLVRSAQCGY